jgi:hypothetical protein
MDMDDPREAIPQSVVLPPKQFMSEIELMELWETRGLKWRVDDFYEYSRNRGLSSHVRKESFRAKVYGMLKAFLINGESRRDPKFIPPPKKLKRV